MQYAYVPPKNSSGEFPLKLFACGLRARVLLLVLAAVIPAFGVIGYTAMVQRQEALRHTEMDAMNLVRLAAWKHRQLIASTRQLLMALSRLPAVRGIVPQACDQVLAELRQPFPYYTNLGVATPDGQIRCSALPLQEPVTIADRSYFKRTMQSRDYGIGEYQTGRVTGITAINFSYPVLAEDGRVDAVVFAALDLAWLNNLVKEIELPPGSNLIVIDSGGTVLAHYPAPETWVGRRMADTPLVKAVLAHRGESGAEFAGFDGVSRLFVSAPLYGGPSGNVHVTVGIAKSMAFAEADEIFARNMTLLLLSAVAALAAAWLGSDAFVLRRVRALAAATRRLAKGDWGARTGLPHSGGELGELAKDFDDMAAALRRNHHALRTLSAGNRALVRATEEPALLQDMCRLIVSVGGYHGAWVGYRDEGHGAMRCVAEAGFEGGVTPSSRLCAGAAGGEVADEGIGPAFAATRDGAERIVRGVRCASNGAAAAEMAVVALPLHGQNGVIGALSICSRDADAFDTDEMELLRETASDLAFGIRSLRLRAEHDRAHETIRRMAYYDRLTGLPNHIQFEEMLEHWLAHDGGEGRSSALLLVDLDRLQEINDALGFQQGDQVLKDAAARLREALGDIAAGPPHEEIIARMRGDEFAVLLREGDAASAAGAAERILTALAKPFQLKELSLDVGATIGISLCPGHGADATRLIRHADVAMHQAKKAGNRYAFYAADRDEASPQRLALVTELRQAIELDQLTLHYQPKVDLRSGRACGVEALVRWKHPERGMMPPDSFIPLAEHTGLIRPLTEWVIMAALRQAAAWRRTGMELPIAVNLSAHSLRDREFLGRLERMFIDWEASADWLEFEITESAIMDDPEHALDILRRLHELGIALFIDDFGTGYSSLSYLQRLPVDALKIDRSFVKDLLEDKDSASIVRSTITLAHDLGIGVVAEGIETAAVRDRLAELACDQAQGYFFGKPMPAEEFAVWAALPVRID